MHPDHRVPSGHGKGEQQPGHELRRERPVHLDPSAADRAPDFDGEITSAVAHLDAQRSERLDQHGHGAVEQRAFAFDPDGEAAQRGDRGEKARGQSRFPDEEAVADRVESAFDGEGLPVDALHGGPEGFDAANRCAGVVAVRQVMQHGTTVRQQRSGQRALRVTFGTGGSEFAS